MKKRRRKRIFMIFAAAAIVGVGMASSVIPAFAESRIMSKGNLALEEEELNLCSADFDILFSEVDALYAEVPVLSDVSFYGTPRKTKLLSRGNLDYADGTIQIHSADFAYLADEIDILEAAYKTNIVIALNNIGTYFLEDGSITYDKDVIASSLQTAARFSFERLYEGIVKSQSVAHLEGEQIYAAIADNLSSGSAAWVNGNLIIGNGADNDAYYNRGYMDGYQEVMNGVNIEYEYHVHTGSESECGGCYQEGYHVHSGCPSHEAGTGQYIQCSFNNGDNNGGEPECPKHGREYLYPIDNGHTEYMVCGFTQEIMEIVYDCGFFDNCWRRNCGMNEDTIISAVICFK